MNSILIRRMFLVSSQHRSHAFLRHFTDFSNGINGNAVFRAFWRLFDNVNSVRTRSPRNDHCFLQPITWQVLTTKPKQLIHMNIQ